MALYIKEKVESRANNKRREREERKSREEKSGANIREECKREQKGREQRKGQRRKAPRHLGLNVPAAASASSGDTSKFLSNGCIRQEFLENVFVTPASESAPLGTKQASGLAQSGTNWAGG